MPWVREGMSHVLRLGLRSRRMLQVMCVVRHRHLRERHWEVAWVVTLVNADLLHLLLQLVLEHLWQIRPVRIDRVHRIT